MSVPIATRSLSLAANTAFLPGVLEFVRMGAAEANLPETRIGELELLIEEIFMNVCWHGYPNGRQGMVTLTYSVPTPGEMSVEVADQGVEFNPLAATPPDLTLHLQDRPIGGFGIFLVKQFAPSVAYRRDRDWNRLTFSISAGPR